jgi:hypothetical protein
VEDVTRSGDARSQSDPGVTAPLEWVFRPWHDRPGMAWGAVGGILASGLLVAAVELPSLIKTALVAFMGIALEPAYLASRFRVDEAGLERSTRLGTIRLPWRSARRWRRHRLGLEVGDGSRAWVPAVGRRLRLFIPDRERDRVLAALDERRRAHGC